MTDLREKIVFQLPSSSVRRTKQSRIVAGILTAELKAPPANPTRTTPHTVKSVIQFLGGRDGPVDFAFINIGRWLCRLTFALVPYFGTNHFNWRWVSALLIASGWSQVTEMPLIR